jgi:hypothetical protein
MVHRQTLHVGYSEEKEGSSTSNLQPQSGEVPHDLWDMSDIRLAGATLNIVVCFVSSMNRAWHLLQYLGLGSDNRVE